MDYVRQMEYAFEDFRRRSRANLAELEEQQRETRDAYNRAVEQALADARRFREEHAEEIEAARAAEAERELLEVEARAEQERLEAEARDQRDSIARSALSRQTQGYEAPSDDDEWDDPDSQYYRRDSWLV
ncbi:hypothetical protein ACFVMC_01600 [Nocardia sp. NPDC127579]|uniref:hypothetical protein n=1 Tax=Nocardia sp. NPDC127579 TaxID=3345402 RepID=UPI003636948B